ncbi:hypothetical protein [Halovibrio salipaludis]|nr:hypothetical protein [Halovibrio salipaludis]
MLAQLEKRGMKAETARQELLNLMRGQRSSTLESMGIQLKARRYHQEGD